MKILAIGRDKKVFEEKSEVRRRMIKYAGLVEEMHLIIFSRKTSFINQRDGNLFLYPTNSNSRVFTICDAYKIGCRILKYRRDFIITTQDPFETGLVGLLLKRRFKIPLQIQIHTDFLNEYFWKESILNRCRVLIAKFLIRYADCIRVVSEVIKKAMEKYFPNRIISKIFVLPVYIDADKIKNAPVNVDLRRKYPQFDFIILMASRFSQEKNIETAVEIMPDILKKFPKTALILVGEGSYKKQIESKIEKMSVRNSTPLKNNIVIEDWQDDIYSYYKSADLFLLTSNYEGYGRTVLESLYAGCPVIMTDVGQADEFKKDFEGIKVVPIKNKILLKKSVIDYIENRKKKLEVGNVKCKTQNLITNEEQYLMQYKKLWEMTEKHFRL